MTEFTRNFVPPDFEGISDDVVDIVLKFKDDFKKFLWGEISVLNKAWQQQMPSISHQV